MKKLGKILAYLIGALIVGTLGFVGFVNYMRYSEEKSNCSVYEQEMQILKNQVSADVASVSLGAIQARIINSSAIPVRFSGIRIAFVDCTSTGCVNIGDRDFDANIWIPENSARDFQYSGLVNTFGGATLKPRGELQFKIDTIFYESASNAASRCLSYRK